MNGLPATIDLGPFVGLELLQVCLGVHQLQLNFESNIRVAVESRCVFRAGEGISTMIENFADSASLICEALGQRVTDARRNVDGGLTMIFSNGRELTILNDIVEYESFQVHIRNVIYVA